MSKKQHAREIALAAIEDAVKTAGTEDPVDQILTTVYAIVDRSHQVAIDQCAKAREQIKRVAADALNTIDLLEQTIDAKRTGTSDQLRHYMEAVRQVQISAEDVQAMTSDGIIKVHESIAGISEQVLKLPTPAPKPEVIDEPHTVTQGGPVVVPATSEEGITVRVPVPEATKGAA